MLTYTGLIENVYTSLEFGSITNVTEPLDNWDYIFKETLDETKPIIKILAENKLPIPIVGYEIENENGMVIAEVELAWVELGIALVLADAPQIKDWEIFSLENIDSLIECIKQRDNK